MTEVRCETKRCHRCRRTKDVADFHKNAATDDGLSPSCKSCVNGKIRQRRGNLATRDADTPIGLTLEAIEREDQRQEQVNMDAFARMRADRERIAGA